MTTERTPGALGSNDQLGLGAEARKCVQANPQMCTNLKCTVRVRACRAGLLPEAYPDGAKYEEMR